MSAVIELVNVSKKFKIFDRPADRLKELLSFGKRKYHKDFWALKDINLSIGKGETVGIIGINGAGKSTLLQLVSGILRPTAGSVTASGRLATLLELGSGFNPDFTGRENIFLSAGVSGLSRRGTEDKLDEIISFADIGEFIDHPVKVYSNGMYLRLAFAIATCIDPDILLVDEVLAVGDALFQQKCYEKIREFREKGKTILLVSHNTDEIKRNAGRCMLIESGRIVIDDTSWNATEFYHKRLNEMQLEKQKDPPNGPANGGVSYKTSGESFFTGEASLEKIEIVNSSRQVVSKVNQGETVEFIVSLRLKSDLDRPRVGLIITDVYGYTVAGTNTEWNGIDFSGVEAEKQFAVSFKMTMNLKAGPYFVTVRLMEKNGAANWRTVLKMNKAKEFFIVGEEKFYGLTDLNRGARLIDAKSETKRID
ncbi:MAG: ABC transporter ATP-binding protein [Candidatus Omnitrophica bacterium]|nr:ABC transporter ATP-binding protein [Candidatus Omnitrophota bacterium]